MIFQVFFLFIFLCYAGLIFTITVGWLRLKEFTPTGSLNKIKVSIVIAVRNEALNVEALLTSLMKQNYPAHLLEIIIVDDHSEDHTSQLAENYSAIHNPGFSLKLMRLNEGRSGKKAALQEGISLARGELIVITDADCHAPASWISTVASFYEKYNPKMILGPVRMTDGGSFFGKLQSIEFLSLISSAAGSCNAGFPLLANGANIAFTRHAFDACNGFNDNLQYASGDDMFLMMNIKKQFGPGSIRFLRSMGAIVQTPATQDFKSFVQQRMRWVSKSRGYADKLLIAASLLVFLTNLSLATAVVSVIFFPDKLLLFVALYVIKLIVDFPLMIGFARFQRSTSLIWLLPLVEIVNSFYTLLIGISGNISGYKWKGRKSSHL